MHDPGGIAAAVAIARVFAWQIAGVGGVGAKVAFSDVKCPLELGAILV